MTIGVCGRVTSHGTDRQTCNVRVLPVYRPWTNYIIVLRECVHMHIIILTTGRLNGTNHV